MPTTVPRATWALQSHIAAAGVCQSCRLLSRGGFHRHLTSELPLGYPPYGQHHMYICGAHYQTCICVGDCVLDIIWPASAYVTVRKSLPRREVSGIPLHYTPSVAQSAREQPGTGNRRMTLLPLRLLAQGHQLPSKHIIHGNWLGRDVGVVDKHCLDGVTVSMTVGLPGGGPAVNRLSIPSRRPRSSHHHLPKFCTKINLTVN